MYRLYKHPYQPVIIDDETAEKKFKEWKELHPVATAVTLDEVLEHIYQSPLIKTAENIYDLIEEGDLIEESDSNEIYKVKIFDNGNNKFRDESFDEYNGKLYVKYEECPDEYYSYIKTLNSIVIANIFKPDSRGNYFKVKVLERDK